MQIKHGVVKSTKMNKTIVVEVDVSRINKKYLKRFSVTNKFYAHDPEEKCKIGDKVIIVECRPLSKLKRWKIKEIVK